MTTPEVRLAQADDMPAFCKIVNHYIATTTLNFRTQAQTPDEWLKEWQRLRERYPWLVATVDAAVVGLAYAGPWKARSAYDWSAEVTVYVADGARRQGIGKALYERLLAILDAQGYRTELAVVALPNPASVALHEFFGFRPAGVLQAVGFKFDAWCDVGFWQRQGKSIDAKPGPIRSVQEVGGSPRACVG